MQNFYLKFNNALTHSALLVRWFLVMAILCNSCFQYANAAPNDVTISGSVKDDTGAPLPGVSILEKGTMNGTVSDADGKFSITVTSNESVLIFSFVGFVTQQVVVGDQSTINIQLSGDPTTLSEVVVVGYGTQEKADVTGAVSSLKSEDFNKGVINTPEQLLQGKVSGVNVVSTSGEPGSPQSITIRGPGGFRTGSTPLFVVDGIPLDNSGTGGAINPLNFLNPNDIASIDVLKDASATAIYGARGGNGVIQIVTKKGKAGTSSVNYSFQYGISKMARALPVLSADEYRQRVPEVGGVLEDSLASTDWQDLISRTAYTKNHELSFSGGSDKFSYYASLGTQDQEGILKNSNLKRYSGRINVSQRFLNDDRISVDLNLNATQTIAERPPIESILGAAISANPTYPAYDENGDPYRYPSGVNPLVTLDLNKDITTTNRVVGNLSPSVKLFKGLEYRMNLGIDYATSVRDIQSKANLLPPQDGRLESYYGTNSNSLIENYLTYTVKKDDHILTALAGHSYQKFFIQTRAFSINKFPISELEPRYNPGLGQDLTLANNKPSGSAIRNELQSFFGRLNYEFKNRYLLTATLRTDGSSKFGKNNKYGTFPSFSAGWRISEEPFMSSLPISNLKLRAGWGQTGNQEIPAKITQSLFTSTVSGSSSYPLTPSGAYPAGTIFVRLANPDIQWEVSTQTNVGIDFGFLRGALTGSIDVFRKVANKILIEVPSFDPKPASSYWTNVEDMKVINNGLELSLNYDYNAGSGFSLSVGGNTTFLKNEIKNSPYSILTTGTATGSGLTSATINGYLNNEPIGTFYLKEFVGIAENGRSIFKDQDGDGVITDKDRVAAGTALPNTIYSFYATVRYKEFDLTANFNGVSGNKIYDNTANAFFYKVKLSKGVNTTDEALRYLQESTSNPADVSTRYLKDGSFLRLNNLTLGYNLKPTAIKLDNWVKSIRFSVTGQNLFVITDYDGYDPEVNIDRTTGAVLSYGIDYLAYPKARTVVLGLNVTF